MLKEFLPGLAVGVVLAMAPVSAQIPAGRTFEVASVKPAALTSLTPAMVQSGKLRIGLTITGARVDISFMSLADLIRTAYEVKAYQISGPDWMAIERFDITAKMPDGATKDDVNLMLRALLAERFKLTVHREKKDRPAYALVVGKGGSKLKESAPEDASAKSDAPPMIIAGGQSVTPSSDGRSVVTSGPSGTVRVSMSPAGEHIEAQKITLAAFADMLTPMVDRPVVDMTDLRGNYQLIFDIPLAEVMALATKAAAAAGIAMPPGVPSGASGGGGSSAAPIASDPTGGSIFEAVQQLGLKLDPRQAPIDVIVIDHVEKIPTGD